MRTVINNIISVIFSLLRFLFIKIFNQKKFKFYLIERFSPNVVIEFNKGSFVRLGKRIRVHSGCKIKARKNSTLLIGKDVRINYNCIIVCHEKIEIGEGTELGPSVYIYDHDHDYRAGLKSEKFKSSPVKIGKNCWIGANTVILKGTQIGDNCVVGAGSVLKGNYEANSVIIQKRFTKVV